ncbi:Invertebrate-AID/APOBEC-deaminase [Phytophthora infestans]|uniref:Invertebrate-AID/APOBEC-deaminase n=1 Tax=Phytophthora infestans TaxID=4787 RepID=A0A8S9UZ77_PHYIN|nr:Invertebrate-AID/APOBEC-deaminase [Phytophthora infestans]
MAHQDESDVAFMRLAVAEAHRSQPSENAYCVGCVVVRDGLVLSTGFSRELPGNTHAEQVALHKLNFEAQGVTVYTTMEPCSTRVSGNVPCVQSCLRAGVARVVIGVMEPKTFVICKGVQLLQEARVDVKLLKGLEADCLAPNAHLNLVF